MEALAEKGNETGVHKKVIIPEDANHKIVQFMNMEGDNADFEFNAGPPLSQNNTNYLFRHGLYYNVPERLRRHVAGLGMPKYEDIAVPGYPGATRSTIVGKTYRFALLFVEDPDVVVIHDHERDKIIIKELPGAQTNDAVIPGKEVNFVENERLKQLESQNEHLSKTLNALTGDYNDLSGKFDKLMDSLGENTTLKKTDDKKEL